MSSLDPKWILLTVGIIVLATVAAATAMVCTGNQQYISYVATISIPIVTMLLGAIGVSAHQTNVQNQAAIGERMGIADEMSDSKKAQDSE